VAGGLLLLVLTVGGYFAARTTSVFDVTRVEVRGAPPSIAREVQRSLDSFVGTSLLDVRGSDVLGRVEAIPSVAAATYDRSFPHTLLVVVRPERPVTILRRGPDSWLVSERGRVLGTVERGARPELPRIWVPKRVAVTIGAVVADPAAKRAVRAVRVVSRETFPMRIRTVITNDVELTFQLASGLEVRLSRESDLELKLAVASRIIPVLAAPADGGPTYLDVSVPERPVVGQTLNSEVEVESPTPVSTEDSR
jgi:cell division septal protein FtsQ